MGIFINMLQRALGLNIQDPNRSGLPPQIESIEHADLNLLMQSGVSAAIDAAPIVWSMIANRTDRPVAVAVSIARMAMGPVETEMIGDLVVREIVDLARASRLYANGSSPDQVVEALRRWFEPVGTTARDVASAYVGASPLNQDQVETLVDLARAGKEQEFRELAAMVGVRAEKLDPMWQGTRRRVRDAR